MIYSFDTSPLSSLFRNFYRSRFPSLWVKFDALVDNGQILSTREVLREINDGGPDTLREWAKVHEEVFGVPTAEEAAFVMRFRGPALPAKYRAEEAAERRLPCRRICHR